MEEYHFKLRYEYMIRIWNTHKVMILIGIVYAGLLLLKLLNLLKRKNRFKKMMLANKPI